MVIHGQSAGGASVDYYSYAWTKDPIISGFIPQSGSAAIRAPVGPGNPATLAIDQWSSLSEKLGCGAVSVNEFSKSLACMRSKPLSQVMDATAPPQGGKSTMGSWGPKVDGKTVFEDLNDRGNKGKFIHAVSSSIPESVNTNSNRISPYSLETPTTRAQTQEQKLAVRKQCDLIVVLAVLLNSERMQVSRLGDISMLGSLRIKSTGRALQTPKVPGTYF
jgi:hypothetical protein